ncbi:hypothetical protein AAFC00_003381 [Neodothiora populina]
MSKYIAAGRAAIKFGREIHAGKHPNALLCIKASAVTAGVYTFILGCAIYGMHRRIHDGTIKTFMCVPPIPEVAAKRAAFKKYCKDNRSIIMPGFQCG